MSLLSSRSVIARVRVTYEHRKLTRQQRNYIRAQGHSRRFAAADAGARATESDSKLPSATESEASPALLAPPAEHRHHLIENPMDLFMASLS